MSKVKKKLGDEKLKVYARNQKAMEMCGYFQVPRHPDDYPELNLNEHPEIDYGPDVGEEIVEYTGINPKDLIGAKKPNLSLIPTGGEYHVAKAMENGAKKYGPYNWRDSDNKVQYMTYLAAAKRHINCFLDGEEEAEDSGIHHLGHACAGLMILLDAIECGNATDNRPPPGPSPRLLVNKDEKR